jgi:hypothetical protein
MRPILLVPSILVAVTVPLAAEMTADQREFEMRRLATTYARIYAPYEWKRDYFQFDLYQIAPWVSRARAAASDLEFFEVAAQYVTSLQDTHATYSLPSNFQASLGFHTDIYDGKILIDNIVRTALPASRYPFETGFELVSIDGVPATELVGEFSRFVASATPRTRARRAAQYLTQRLQAVIPRAHEIGDSATVVVRSPSGAEASYTIPWNKFFAPVTTVGLLPSPVLNDASRLLPQLPFFRPEPVREQPEDILPPWYAPLREFRNMVDPSPADMVLNYGSVNPIYALPPGFQRRFTTDVFYSGIFLAGERRIGLIRIPNFAPVPGAAAAIRQFEGEMTFFQANTDGLVIDVMRNNGGDGCYAIELLRRVIPYQFQAIGFELRASQRVVNSFAAVYEAAKALGADRWETLLHKEQLDAVVAANRESRGRTGALSVCGPTVQTLPANVVYTKPVMVLTDDFSTSAADLFPAIFQDAGRGPVFGYRTNGAGGAVSMFDPGIFSEAEPRVTLSLMVRARPITVEGYPTTSYVENVGVHPDIPFDFMTVENLNSGRRLYTEAFTRAIVEHINRQ